MVNERRAGGAARESNALARGLPAVRALFAAMVAVALASGILGGLLRVGVMLPSTAGAPWLGRAALFHAALMICGFLGTVIGIERAVAVRSRGAFVAPLASGAGGVCLALGHSQAGAWLMVVAAAAFVAVNAVIVRRQRAVHTWLLLGSAVAWLVGCALFAAGVGRAAALPWWFAFLATTIAAERLEMTRLMRRRPGLLPLLGAPLSAMLVGAAWFGSSPVIGGLLFGLSLVLLAAWLAVYDVARRTLFSHGLSRYMAVCLLSGYLWLAVAGCAWAGMAFGLALRDVALHAFGLGFIVSMIMGHAPVILPAVARIRLQFGAVFYVPLVALHLSLALRLGAGHFDSSIRAVGSALNAVAIGLFALTVAGAAVAWRLKHGARGIGRPGRNDSSSRFKSQRLASRL